MKNSKLKIILALLIGLIVGVLGACGVYFATVGQVAWEIYIKEMIVPNVVLALTTIIALWVAASPIIKKVLSALGLFNQATTDINKTVEKGKESKDNIESMTQNIKEGFDKICNDIKTEFKEHKETVQRIDKATTNTEEITRIGFGNMDELVNKGFAAEIAKVGVEDEREENEE